MRDPYAQLEGGGGILSARGRVEHTGLFGGPRASSVMLRGTVRGNMNMNLLLVI